MSTILTQPASQPSRLPRFVEKALLGLHRRLLAPAKDISYSASFDYRRRQGLNGQLLRLTDFVGGVLVRTGNAVPASEIDRMEERHPGILLEVLRDDRDLSLRPVYDDSYGNRRPTLDLVVHHAYRQHGHAAAEIILEDEELYRLPSGGSGLTFAHFIAWDHPDLLPVMMRDDSFKKLRDETGDTPFHRTAGTVIGALAIVEQPALGALENDLNELVAFKATTRYPEAALRALDFPETYDLVNSKGRSVLEHLDHHWVQEIESYGNSDHPFHQQRCEIAREVVTRVARIREVVSASALPKVSRAPGEEAHFRRMQSLLDRLESHAVTIPVQREISRLAAETEARTPTAAVARKR